MTYAIVKVQCLRCSVLFSRWWPAPYGTTYVYAGVCDPCKGQSVERLLSQVRSA